MKAFAQALKAHRRKVARQLSRPRPAPVQMLTDAERQAYAAQMDARYARAMGA